MQHIILPREPAFDPIEVPCLFRSEYSDITWDSGQFNNFPERMGFDQKAMLQGDFTSGGRRTVGETAWLLQCWLWFGVMGTTFYELVSLHDWTYRNASGKYCITTRRLPDSLRLWQRLNSAAPAAELREKNWLAQMCFHEVELFMKNVLKPELPPDKSPSPLCPEILLSIMLLAEALSYAAKHVYGVYGDAGDFDFGRSWFLASRLKAYDWCVSDIEMMESSLKSPSLLFATLLGRRKFKRDHSICNRNECRAMQLNERTYESRHICPSYQFCGGSLLAPADQITATLREAPLEESEEPFPLITITFSVKQGILEPQLNIMKYEQGITYVAFSHVWADGLGNPRSNSLPACQLKRLQHFANRCFKDVKIPTPIPFWIDTLCVPVTAGKEARKLAISKMNHTYSLASAVIIIDEELVDVVSDAPDCENMIRIILSPWMRRLWTLQEARAQPRRLFFQFRGRVESALGLWALNLKSWGEGGKILHTIQPEMASLWHKFTGIDYYKELDEKGENEEEPEKGAREDDTPPHRKINKDAVILEAIRWRSTSHQRDELTCLGQLFGGAISFSGFQTEAYPDEETRQKKLVQYNLMFPQDFIFMDGPRMNEAGFRWCPKTLLSRDFDGNIRPRRHTLNKQCEPGLLIYFPGTIRNRHDVEPTAGLHVTYPGYLLDITSLARLAPTFYLYVEGQIVNPSVYDQEETNGQWYMVSYDPALSEGRDWRDLLVHHLHRPAIIYPRIPQLDSVTCALVDLYPDDDPQTLSLGWGKGAHELRVKFVTTLVLQRIAATLWNYHSKEALKKRLSYFDRVLSGKAPKEARDTVAKYFDKEKNLVDIVRGSTEELYRNQKWVVG